MLSYLEKCRVECFIAIELLKSRRSLSNNIVRKKKTLSVFGIEQELRILVILVVLYSRQATTDLNHRSLIREVGRCLMEAVILAFVHS